MRQYTIILLVIALSFCMAESLPAAMEGSAIPDQQIGQVDGDPSFLSDPYMKVLGEYYSNSSDFERQSIGTEFGFVMGRRVNLGVGYAFTDFSQNGFKDIFRNKFFIQGESQVSEKIGIAARISENIYDNENENFNGGLFLRYRPQTNLFTEISFRHFDIIDTVLPFNNAIYSYVVTIGSIDRNIQSDDYKVYLLYHPTSRISYAGEVTYGNYSDDNEKLSLMFEAGYQLLDRPYLRIAYNYFYLDIENPAPLTRGGELNESAYWDPVNFDTHTLRFEFRKDFFKYLSFGADGAFSYSFDSEGISKTGFLYISHRVRKQMSLRLDARWFDQDKGVDRLGLTDSFNAANYSIDVQYRF